MPILCCSVYDVNKNVTSNCVMNFMGFLNSYPCPGGLLWQLSTGEVRQRSRWRKLEDGKALFVFCKLQET